MARKVGSAAKRVGGKVLDKLGHGDDAEMMRDLQRKMNMPQTGMTPGAEPNPKVVKEKMSPAKAKSFAALAEPKDKITFADKIAGAKKEVDEMLGDVAAEAMKSALSGGQKKLDKNKNGKLDANDFAMLRKGGKQGTSEAAGAIDFDKVLDAIAALYGDDIWENDAMQDLANDLEQAGPTDRELDFIIAKGKLPKRLAGIQFSAGDNVKFDEGWDDMLKDVERRRGATKKGEVTHGAKHDITDTGTGRRVQRRTDPNTGYSVGADADDKPADGEKRGRGRPKSASKEPERVTANATKHKGGRKVKEDDHNSDEVKQAMAMLKKAGYTVTKAADKAEELDEKAVSKKQQKFMGMVHATQKGERPASGAVAKVAKTMKKGDAEDFASTKHKGLPEKKKPEAKSDAPKKKKTEEAGGTGTPTASSGFSYGQGIYDSMNRDLESMIAESINVNMSTSTEGNNSLTVTATDEDAAKLAIMLKSAGLGGDSEGYGGSGYKSSCGCDAGADCSCDQEMDEAAPAVTDNQPNWPTNQETAQDNFEYSGGLNKPKSTGQTTVPVISSQQDRDGTYAEEEEDAIKRMMEMAGVKSGKKPDFLDIDKDGDKAEPFKKAVDDKKEKKVDEGILAATANLWSEYKGKYGV
jgi:hypothetical protein